MPLNAAQLADLIERQAASLRLWVRGRGASAEDVVQEAFCKLAVQEPPPENPIAWLYRVCRNLAANQRLSDDRRRQREQLRSRPESAADAADNQIDQEDVLRAVEALDGDLRDVVVARLWGQLTLEEVANFCGISTSTAFRRYETALRTLRSKLEQEAKAHHD